MIIQEKLKKLLAVYDRRISILIVFGLVVFLVVVVFGCNKKQRPQADKPNVDASDILTIDIEQDLADTLGLPEETLPEPEVISIEVDSSDLILPTPKQLQTALKNAGYYSGNIDGKIGPQSKEAIQEFQLDNNLTVDGKVGRKTWAVLKDYLK